MLPAGRSRNPATSSPMRSTVPSKKVWEQDVNDRWNDGAFRISATSRGRVSFACLQVSWIWAGDAFGFVQG